MSLRFGTSSLDEPAAPVTPDPRMPLVVAMRRGAGWFLTISILSGINTLLQVFDANLRFIFGLGTTQVIDALAHGRGNAAMIPMVLVDGMFLGILLLCWHYAKAGSQGAFLVGMIAYALDGALLLLFRVWLDAAVHAYALFMIWRGYAAARELARTSQAAQAGASEPIVS